MKPKRVTFKVSFALPEEATVAEARAYVEDAVATMKGCLRPYGWNIEYPDDGDPMSELDEDTVRVTIFKVGGKVK